MVNNSKYSAAPFLHTLPEDIQSKLLSAASISKYADGGLIHSRGDDKPGLSIIKSGSVHAGIIGPDGSFVMTSILGPGHVFGEFTLFANLPRTHDISAAGPTEIYQIPAAKFMKLYETEPEISRALLSSALVRLHTLLEMLDAIRRLPIRERTAKILLSIAQLAGNTKSFKCRQSDLAFTLGISRVSTGKALKQLEHLGLLELGYGVIELPYPDRLTDWVEQHCNVALQY